MRLFQIYHSVCQWKIFENRLTFEEVMGKSLVSCFFDSQCISVYCDDRINVYDIISAFYNKNEVTWRDGTVPNRRIGPERRIYHNFLLIGLFALIRVPMSFLHRFIRANNQPVSNFSKWPKWCSHTARTANWMTSVNSRALKTRPAAIDQRTRCVLLFSGPQYGEI